MRRLLAAGCLAVLATGCGTPLTADRVGSSVAEAFGGLYTGQQQLLGRTDLRRAALAPLASCRRSGPDTAGPGEDWTCTVQYVDGTAAAAQTFELQVKPDGCWRAEGPPGTQPAELADPVNGARVVNPLAEFDGCVDTSWR